MYVDKRKGDVLSEPGICQKLTIRGLLPDVKHLKINMNSSSAPVVALPRGKNRASKSATAKISRVLAARLGPHDISVFDMQPALIETEMTATMFQSCQKHAEKSLFLFVRAGSADEVGGVIASPETGRMPYVGGSRFPSTAECWFPDSKLKTRHNRNHSAAAAHIALTKVRAQEPHRAAMRRQPPSVPDMRQARFRWLCRSHCNQSAFRGCLGLR